MKTSNSMYFNRLFKLASEDTIIMVYGTDISLYLEEIGDSRSIEEFIGTYTEQDVFEMYDSNYFYYSIA